MVEMKRIFMVHGWDGFPENHWFPWLKKELEKIGFKVTVPKMPDTSNPKINSWVSFLEKSVGAIDIDAFFIGHSIGG